MTDNTMFIYDSHTNTKPYHCIALIDGLQVVYGKADPEFTQVTDRPYLGRGTIYSANGVPQLGKDSFHFWGAMEGETLRQTI